MVISARVGERSESGYPRNATLIMDEKHLAVELDGKTHLFNHHNLRYDGPTKTPHRPKMGAATTFSVEPDTGYHLDDLSLSVYKNSILIESGGEAWSFDARGLKLNGHGQEI